MKEEEKKLITNDARMNQSEADMLTSGPFKKIDSVEELMELGRMAVARKKEFDDSISKNMTVERARRIRELRQEASWRSVAAQTFEDWGKDADWWPESNQLAGMSLCEYAAKILGENKNEEPWN